MITIERVKGHYWLIGTGQSWILRLFGWNHPCPTYVKATPKLWWIWLWRK